MNDNQKIFFNSMFGVYAVTVAVGILAPNGGLGADAEVFLHVLIIIAISAPLMFWWVKKNPDFVDRFFQ